jgi:hypothetical protein
MKKECGQLYCAKGADYGHGGGPKLPYTEALLSYTNDQGWSLFKYPRDVMFHIVLVSETLLTG